MIDFYCRSYWQSAAHETLIEVLIKYYDHQVSILQILEDRTTKNQNDSIQLQDYIISNDRNISSLYSRTTKLEGKADQDDFYFKYKADT